MKKLIILITAITMFSSCSKDDIETSGLIGAWSNGKTSFEFKANSDVVVGTSEGTYSTKGDIVTLVFSDKKKYPFKYTVNGNNLSLKAEFEVIFGDRFNDSYNLVRE